MSTLPIFSIREQFLSALNICNRVIIKAPTGSGKSTQIPQILLDSGLVDGEILVLEPRRLAARMLANRVAAERGGTVGGETGFQTRYETMVSSQTRIRFITEGILPRLMLSDRLLKPISAVIFDEFHERSLTVDIGLALIRQLQQNFRPDLKLIVMSATLSGEMLEEYLMGAQTIVSEGRTFPVSVHHLTSAAKDAPWDGAAEAVRYLIGKQCDGDILIFMPGIYEIRKTAQLLKETSFGEPLQVMMLYGDLSAELQQQVMEPGIRRKIIVATNIAETSLTIPGVRHVVDSGLARINRYDQSRGFNTLYVEKISIDSADQRAGRAGREAPGSCIRLWSVSDHHGRACRTAPEISRVDLSEAVLQLKMLGFDDIRNFPWLESPEPLSIHAALELLQTVGAMDADGQLTKNGRAMAELPMHPRLGRLLIEASMRGVTKQGALAAALLTERPLFIGSPEFPEEIVSQSAGSDFEGIRLLINRIIQSRFDPALCAKYNINISALRQILRTEAYYLQICRKRGLYKQDNDAGPHLLSQAVLMAYNDRLARRRDKGTLQCELAHGKRGDLDKDSLARKEQLLVITTVRELKSRQQTTPRVVLSLACSVDEGWLKECFPQRWQSISEYVWNTIRQAVEVKEQTVCCGVVIQENICIHPDVEKAGEVLAQNLIDRKLPLNGWGTDVHDYINRLQWLSTQFPERSLPSFGTEERELVIHELCRGEFRYDAVKDKPLIGFIKELLSWEQQRLVETLAPQVIVTPKGRKLKIIYKADQKPVIRARIQELFDLKATPRIAEGRVGVVLEILAPNMRPVQITEDFEGFWNNHYPELRKTLSRRYPKHEWR